MTTKKQSSATTSHKSGNTRVNSATINVASVNVPAPTGNGLSDGTKVTGSEPVAVGSSSASAKRAARMDYNTKLYNAIKFEQIGVMGARELAAKVTARFRCAEWIGPKADSVRAMLDSALDERSIKINTILCGGLPQKIQVLISRLLPFPSVVYWLLSVVSAWRDSLTLWGCHFQRSWIMCAKMVSTLTRGVCPVVPSSLILILTISWRLRK